jgi:hypothetical protein
LTGNGSGDYLGANIWAFGGENETNNGYTGKVTITGKCDSQTPPCSPTVLFESTGSNVTFKNDWAGWYATGTTVSSGNGKRPAYDTLKIDALRLSDASGRYVEYDLGPGYKGRTLQDIVSKCMGTQRSNTNIGNWKAGQCSNVGTMTSQSNPKVANVNNVLRIGVGDGSADGADWALIMPLTGNGSGDYLGANIWAFGGENETNNGYTGKVTITGKCHSRITPKRTCHSSVVRHP